MKAVKKQMSSSPRTYTVLDPMVVADIGAADGGFANELIENVIVGEYGVGHVTKYNIDPFGLRDEHTVITLRHDDFSNHFPANHCDLIICRFSAHLFDGYFEWLRNCCRILRPGGCLYVMNMSSTMDWSGHWGKDAHRTYLESVDDPNSTWQAASGPLPMSKDNGSKSTVDAVNDMHVRHCTVNHHHFSGPISLKRKGWRKFVEKQGWSNLMRLNPEEVRNAVAFIDAKYGNSEKVDMEMKWTLSVIQKKKRTLSKL